MPQSETNPRQSRRPANPAHRLAALACLVTSVLIAACGAPAGGLLQPGASATAPGASGPATSPSSSGPSSSMPSTSPSADPVAASGTPSPPAFPLFGFAGHPLWDEAADAMRALDMLAEDHIGLLRLDASWRNMEPAPGRYQYLDKLDRIVEAAEARGIALVIAVIEAPGWANGGGDLWTPPQRPDDYARFIGMLATRYSGRVLGWEIWNEPDLAAFWHPQPSASGYAALVRAASSAVRAADPAARVVAAGATFGNFAFMEGLYQAGARGTFDALAVHPYTLTRAPDDVSDRTHSLVAILDDAHSVMAANGDGAVPIWVTELGWATTGVNSVSPALQAQYMVQSVGIVRERPWVQVLAMYTIDVRHSVRHGLSEDGRRSASWIAYVEAIRNGG